MAYLIISVSNDRSESFKQETEHVINELKGSAHSVEAQLRTMESQTITLAQQNEQVIAEQKLLQTKMQEHSNQLTSEYNRLHAEMRERVKDGFSGMMQPEIRRLFNRNYVNLLINP